MPASGTRLSRVPWVHKDRSLISFHSFIRYDLRDTKRLKNAVQRRALDSIRIETVFVG